MSALTAKVSITRALAVAAVNARFAHYMTEDEQQADIAEAEQAGDIALTLISGVKLLLSAAPAHMTHRNAVEREAYKKLRDAMESIA